MRGVDVPDEYRCPLCPEHQDDAFERTPFLDLPICSGCAVELDHYALTPYERLSSPTKRWADEIARLAGRSWDDFRVEVLAANLLHWQGVDADRSGRWWRVMLEGQRWCVDQCEAVIHGRVAELIEAIAEADRGHACTLDAQ